MFDRRQFLRLGAGALVSSATMAEAGMLAELLDWIRRKPVFSIPKPSPIAVSIVLLEDSAFNLQEYLAHEFSIMEICRVFQVPRHMIEPFPKLVSFPVHQATATLASEPGILNRARAVASTASSHSG